MVEYLGGLLAGSKSPGGRDDRAVTWTRIVTGLSSFQIRAHYLLYRELASHLHNQAPDLDMSYEPQMKRATLYLDLDEFEAALMALIEDGSEDSAESPEAILRHSLFGLCRIGLLYDSWHYRRKDEDKACPLLKVRPTGRGMELDATIPHSSLGRLGQKRLQSPPGADSTSVDQRTSEVIQSFAKTVA
jgi:hypothetical protein